MGYLAVQRLNRSTTTWGASQGTLQSKVGWARVLATLRGASLGILQHKHLMAATPNGYWQDWQELQSP